MAQVDLYGDSATRVRGAYKDYLGRDAQDTEVTDWLSGRHGQGDQSNVDPILRFIQNSPEAIQRKNPGTSPPAGTVVGQGGQNGTLQPTTQAPYQNLDWWSSQGVPQTQMFDANGQMQSGWSRTASGYERTGAQGGGQQGPPDGNYQNWFLNSLTSGLAPSGRNLESLAPKLQQYGIKLGGRNAQGMIDTIVLPDGTSWDVIESATLDGGKRWHWNPAGGSGGSGGVGGGQLPGNQYSDPYSRMMEELVKARIGMLQGGINDPYRAQYQQGMQSRANALGAAEPQYQQLLGYLQKRFGELQGPGYTGAENEVIRTQALDPIENDRSAAKKRVMEQISARGFDPKSGIAQQMLADVDKAFDGMRSESQTVLTTNDLARRESRQQRAESIGGALVDIPQARAREQLDVFGALDALSSAMRGEEESRSREAIGYAGGLNDLSMQRFQMALQAAGLGGNPASLMGGLQGMMGLNQNASLMNSRNSSQLWSGLGSIAAMLANSGR